MSTHPHGAADPSQRELFHRLQTLDDMIHASEEADERYRRIADRRRIPPMPDMRFEYSYLRGVRQYVQLEHPARPTSSEKGKEKATDIDGEDEEEGEQEQQLGTRQVVQVQWGRILWITTRDQVISPLLQGALWCVQILSFSISAAHGANLGAGAWRGTTCARWVPHSARIYARGGRMAPHARMHRRATGRSGFGVLLEAY